MCLRILVKEFSIDNHKKNPEASCSEFERETN